MNSNQKGKRGEREWAAMLEANGLTARRGRQFKGTPDSPDVICEAMPGWHCEVKRVEALNIHRAMGKAQEDAGPCQVPYVAHRKNGKPWLVTMDAQDFLDLIKKNQI